MIDPLDAISTVDGRYRGLVEELALYFSERAFMRYRIATEVAYLLFWIVNYGSFGNIRFW
jgi:hypothetical protein